MALRTPSLTSKTNGQFSSSYLDMSQGTVDDRSDSDVSTWSVAAAVIPRQAQWAINLPIRKPLESSKWEDSAARCYIMSVEQVTSALTEVKKRLEQSHPVESNNVVHPAIDERSDESDCDIPLFRPISTSHAYVEPTEAATELLKQTETGSIGQHSNTSVTKPGPYPEVNISPAGFPIPEETPSHDAQVTAPKIPVAKIERATEKQIADYALVVDPLGQWAATTIRSMYAALMGVIPIWSVSALAFDIKNVLRRLLLSPVVVVMALYRLSSFPLKDFRFLDIILRQGDSKAPFKLFCLASLLSSKWLEDDSYTNRTWQEVTQIPVRDFNELEYRVLTHLGYRLSISPDTWNTWLDRLRILHSSAPHIPPPLAPIGSHPYPDHHVFMEKAIARLISSRLPATSSALTPLQPQFLGKWEPVQVQEGNESLPPLFEEDIDLDEGGPLKEEYLPRAVREERERKEKKEQENHLMQATEATLPPPSEWSPENDPVFERPVNNKSIYTAIVPPPRHVAIPIFRQNVQLGFGVPRRSDISEFARDEHRRLMPPSRMQSALINQTSRPQSTLLPAILTQRNSHLRPTWVWT